MSGFSINGLILTLLVVFYPCTHARILTENDLELYRNKTVRMFEHAYNGYIKHAYPYDELRPLTCDGHDTWGSYSLTLIDALDMLVVIGNYSEFRRVTDLLLATLDFDKNINVSVFETNIRVVGGLLSAHMFSHRAGLQLEPGWPCSGPLLRLAEKVARKLLPAFNTSTGMPYGTVNLLYGVPPSETTITCTAGVGTFIVEFGTLSRLTGDPVFEDVALRALWALWDYKSEVGLVGNHIDVATGKWTATDAGIGAGVDSYFEYLVKGSILFGHTELIEMFYEYLASFDMYLKREDWYLWASMHKGTLTQPMFQSLDAYFPGVLSLVGQIDKAMKTIHNYQTVARQFGFTPEFFNVVQNNVINNREGYPLRPELIESAMYLYRATKDPFLLQIGADILDAIEHSCKTSCGYATVKDVRTHSLDNRMESFFLAETTKYLYMLFTPDHFLHNTGDRGQIITSTHGECVIDAGGYVFNTEAHPIDPAVLYCCGVDKLNDDDRIEHLFDNLDLLRLLDLAGKERELFNDGEKHAKRKSPKKKQEAVQDSEESKKEEVVPPSTNDGEQLVAGATADEPRIDSERTENSNVPNDLSDNSSVFDADSDGNGVCWSGEQAVKHLPIQRRNVTRVHGVGRLLSCPAQPIHMRLSLMGELFV